MKHKAWYIILSTIVFALVLWIGSKIALNGWYEPGNEWKYGSKIAALSTTMFMSWSFILASRWRWVEEFVGGLDKVYHIHKWIGIFSFALIGLHPLFLSFKNTTSFTSWVSFFGLQGFDSSYNIGHFFGLLAYLGFLILLLLSSQIKIPYHWWQRSHTWFGLVWIIVIVHIILVDRDVARYPLLQLWVYSWIMLGLFAYIWKTFLYPRIGHYYKYVVDVVDLQEGTTEIIMQPLGEKMPYKPGQFVYVSFPELGYTHARHPFSLASAPKMSGEVKLGIKSLGDFTSIIPQLKKGDTVLMHGPYGTFGRGVDTSKRDAVFIGGGIGITPFIGMWDHAIRCFEGDRKATLLYCVKHAHDIPFDNDITAVDIRAQFENYPSSQERGFDYHLHDTSHKGYISAYQIQHEYGVDVLRSEFYICGPTPMMKSLTNQLVEAGVPLEYIHSESFQLLRYPKKWYYLNPDIQDVLTRVLSIFK